MSMVVFNGFIEAIVQLKGSAIAASSLGLVTLGGLSLISIWSTLHTCKKGISHLKRLHQVPCSRCQYFTGDYRLKCTVQPTTACTDAAISCRDFAPISPISQSACQLSPQSCQTCQTCQSKEKAKVSQAEERSLIW